MEGRRRGQRRGQVSCRVCMCTCVRVCVRACVRACVCVCARARERDSDGVRVASEANGMRVRWQIAFEPSKLHSISRRWLLARVVWRRSQNGREESQEVVGSREAAAFAFE